MAIYEKLTNTDPMNAIFMATKLDVQAVPARITGIPVDFCYCRLECEYTELALAKIGGTDRENDTTAFLFRKFIPADTITFKLLRNDIVVATIVDDTFGEFFPAGSLTVPENPDSVNYVGFRVSWLKVFTVEGPGRYQIQADTTILGDSQTTTSHFYRCTEYSEFLADRTVRIRTIQNGNIESIGIDYTGLNWQQTIRISGKLFNKTPRLETDNYVDQNLKKQQIRDQIVNTYTLETYLLPSEVANKIIYDLFLSNRILVTDYWIWNEDLQSNEKTYNDVELYPEEFEEPRHFSRSTRRAYRFTFVDRIQNIRKSNF